MHVYNTCIISLHAIYFCISLCLYIEEDMKKLELLCTITGIQNGVAGTESSIEVLGMYSKYWNQDCFALSCSLQNYLFTVAKT